jgi:hypothetical protein
VANRFLNRKSRGNRSGGVPITTVAKRLGHANANIALPIYAHALEADELAAAKIWDDAMVEVIGAQQRRPERNPAMSNAEGAKKLEVDENEVRRMAGTTGLEPATSDVTGRRSNQLNYVPALCGRSQCSTHTTLDHGMHKNIDHIVPNTLMRQDQRSFRFMHLSAARTSSQYLIRRSANEPS